MERIKCVETSIKIAGTAPSGANKQPWTYVVFDDDEGKTMVAIFKQNYGVKIEEGKEIVVKHYYAQDSSAISAGFFIGALDDANIEYEVLPINEQLNQLLNRPVYEKPLLLVTINNFNENSKEKLDQLYEQMKTRRSIRRFKKQMVEEETITNIIQRVDNIMKCILTKKSYYFERVPNDLKERIRKKCEENEKRLYEELISDEWRSDLAPLKTNWKKEHLSEASHLVVVFNRKGQSRTEAGIAIGLFIQSLHLSGLGTLTYTPSPMSFLKEMFNTEDTPIMVLPVGYKASNYIPPNIIRKKINEIIIRK